MKYKSRKNPAKISEKDYMIGDLCSTISTSVSFTRLWNAPIVVVIRHDVY